MNKKLARRDTPEERELSQKLEEFLNLQALLAQRELDLTTLHAESHAFERHYFRVVGVRYAELDEIEAQIADLLSRSSPQNQEVRMQASEARGRANESAHESKVVQETAGHQEKFKPSDDLKKLYRDVAKSIHPDLATDDDDRARHQRFMAEANQAYEEGNEIRLREILREWESSPDAVQGDGVAAELIRVIRKIAQVQARLRTIEATIDDLQSSDLYRLKSEVESAEAEERDLLTEMAARLAKRYRQAAEQGHARAQYKLGLSYDEGRGVPQDDAQAAHWFRQAAEQGDAEAQYKLGVMYDEGRIIPHLYSKGFRWGREPQADAEAVRWYRRAAEQEHAKAQYNLALMLRMGAVRPDYAEAIRWYHRAAEQGHAEAQNSLGVMYDVGRDVQQDYSEAARWYGRAAEQGHAHAQLILGDLYDDGRGVPQDYIQAHKWFNLAASRGSSSVREVAVQSREEVGSKMTPAQIAEAQRLAREWKPDQK